MARPRDSFRSEEEHDEAVARLLRRYPLAPRVRRWEELLAKLGPTPALKPVPSPKLG